MNDPHFSHEGDLIDPDLHDAFIDRIDFAGSQVVLYCRTSVGSSTRLEFDGVKHMFSAGLAEQNIVLDVTLEDGLEICSKLLRRFLSGTTAENEAYVSSLLEQLRLKQLRLVHVSPSYGGELVILFERAHFEEVGGR